MKALRDEKSEGDAPSLKDYILTKNIGSQSNGKANNRSFSMSAD
jgi:hypothetical protein